MRTQWTPVKTDTQGINRYRGTNQKAEAWIQRNPDGSAVAKEETGFFGTHVTSYMVAPAPSDEVILDKLDRSAYPPRFDDWKQSGQNPETNTTEYKGTANNFLNSPVKAQITRVGDSAKVSAKVGHFGLGTHIDGVFFAPAPSDMEILRRISD
ncbi:MAG: hypothetical protein WC314_16575 [Vulcanimicrobiota bacterium]